METTTTTTCEGCWDETCPVCNPTAKSAANGWKGEPSKLHGNGSVITNPASDKQVGYLRSLCQRTGEPMPALPIGKTEASRLIDRLVNQSNKAGTTGATDKQANFIRSLGAELGLNEVAIEAVLTAITSPKHASSIIDGMKLDVNNNRMLVAEQRRMGKIPAGTPQASELEDAIYKIDGEVRKVYHTQSGQQVAKRWDGDLAEWEYIGKRGLRGLTPDHKMTLAEAVEFGSIYGRCCNCGRQLTDEHSIEAGIGPVCAKRFA